MVHACAAADRTFGPLTLCTITCIATADMGGQGLMQVPQAVDEGAYMGTGAPEAVVQASADASRAAAELCAAASLPGLAGPGAAGSALAAALMDLRALTSADISALCTHMQCWSICSDQCWFTLMGVRKLMGQHDDEHAALVHAAARVGHITCLRSASVC